MKHFLKTRFKIVYIALVFVFALMIFCLSILYLPDTAWYQRIVSSRLNAQTTQNLCLKFELPDSHDLCDRRGTVYAYDFYIFIEERLGNANSRYEDFEHYLGDYNTWERKLPSTTKDSIRFSW